MTAFRQVLQYLLLYKDLLSLAVQLVLLFAIFSLIRAATNQAKAAVAQSKAAIEQVRAADLQAELAHIQSELLRKQLQAAELQLENAREQEKEQARQAVLSQQPHLQFRDADPGFRTSPVIIRNAGPGIAYRISWRFASPNKPELLNQVYEAGTLDVGQEIALPWGYDRELPRLQTRFLDEFGIRVECMDSEGRLYSTSLKLNEKREFVTESARVLPTSSPAGSVNPFADRAVVSVPTPESL